MTYWVLFFMSYSYTSAHHYDYMGKYVSRKQCDEMAQRVQKAVKSDDRSDRWYCVETPVVPVKNERMSWHETDLTDVGLSL